MFSLFESLDEHSLEKYLKSLNVSAGESGNIIDRNRLLSVISSADYYIDKKEKIASIVRGLIKNHPFFDGNKRTALLFFLLMSEIGKIDVYLDSDKLENSFVNIAKNNYSVEDIVKILYSNPNSTEQLREWINYCKDLS